MAKQNAKASAKAPKEKKAAPAKPPVPVDGAEPMPEASEAATPATDALLPEGMNEVAAQGSGGEAAPGEASLPGAQAVAEESPEPEGRRAVVRSPKGLNLRAGPALSYEALEVLPDGMEVLALDLPRGAAVPGWELVDAGGRTGWASARFLRRLEG